MRFLPITSSKPLIQEALETVEKELNDILKRHLTPQDILLLDNLFQKSPFTKMGAGVVKYDLTLFKKIPESMENQEILKRVEMFIQIKAMYEQLFPVIKRLNLSHTTTSLIPKPPNSKITSLSVICGSLPSLFINILSWAMP